MSRLRIRQGTHSGRDGIWIEIRQTRRVGTKKWLSTEQALDLCDLIKGTLFAESYCTRHCSEMHTYEPGCLLAPDAEGVVPTVDPT